MPSNIGLIAFSMLLLVMFCIHLPFLLAVGITGPSNQETVAETAFSSVAEEEEEQSGASKQKDTINEQLNHFELEDINKAQVNGVANSQVFDSEPLTKMINQAPLAKQAKLSVDKNDLVRIVDTQLEKKIENGRTVNQTDMAKLVKEKAANMSGLGDKVSQMITDRAAKLEVERQKVSEAIMGSGARRIFSPRNLPASPLVKSGKDSEVVQVDFRHMLKKSNSKTRVAGKEKPSAKQQDNDLFVHKPTGGK